MAQGSSNPAVTLQDEDQTAVAVNFAQRLETSMPTEEFLLRAILAELHTLTAVLTAVLGR